MKTLNRCDGCGSELYFDIEKQCLACKHCGNTRVISGTSVSATKHPYTENADAEKNTDKTTQYECSTCGVKHSVSVDEIITRCPSCGARTLTKSTQFSYKPDGVVPFHITKEQASKLFIGWIRKRRLAPNSLKKLFKLKKMSASYFPIWAFDFDVSSSYKGVAEYDSTDSEGHTSTSRRRFSGNRMDAFKNYLMNANTKIASSFIKKMGYFGIEEVKPYNPEYLYGFASVEKNITLQDSIRLARNETSSLIKDNIKSDQHCDRIASITLVSDYWNQKYALCLVPIWATYYTFKQKSYECYINAKDGTVTGTSPKSGWKIFFLVLGIIAGIVGLSFLFAYFG